MNSFRLNYLVALGALLIALGCSDDTTSADGALDGARDGGHDVTRADADGGGGPDGDAWMGGDAGPAPDPNMLPGCSTACGADQVCKGGACVDVPVAAACGSDKWGGAPSSKVLYVDQSYGGSDSDGSAQKPYVSIADALAKLPGDGYTLAITDGTYGQSGPLLITRSVALRCRCPQNVRIASPLVVTRTQSSPTLPIQVEISRCHVAPAATQPTSAPACSGSRNDEPRGVTLTQPQSATQPVQLSLRDDTRIDGWCTGVAVIGAHADDALCLSSARVSHNVRGIDATSAAAALQSALPGCTMKHGVSIEDSRIDHNTDYGVYTRLGATALGCKTSLIDANGTLSATSKTGLGYGIYHGGVTTAAIIGCRVRGNENRGAAFINTQTSAVTGAIAISDSVFDDNVGAGVALQDLSLSGGVTFFGSRAAATRKLAGSDDAEGIQTSVGGGTSYDVIISSSSIDGNGRTGVLMDGVGGTVKDNTIARNGSYGCLLQKTGNNVAVSGNTYAQNPAGNLHREPQNPLQQIAALPLPLP